MLKPAKSAGVLQAKLSRAIYGLETCHVISLPLGVISQLNKSSKSLGKFILRVPPALHTQLKADALRAGSSLNEHCTRILESGGAASRTDDAFARDLVDRAERILGDALAGVIVYGSWVRGEAADTSDIDVMLVAERGATITRSLLANWDSSPLNFDGRPVQAHFISLPASTGSISGLWAELAIDGVVVFERGFEVSRRLARARSEIAAGRLQRRRSHGQNYWVHTKDEVA